MRFVCFVGFLLASTAHAHIPTCSFHLFEAAVQDATDAKTAELVKEFTWKMVREYGNARKSSDPKTHLKYFVNSLTSVQLSIAKFGELTTASLARIATENHEALWRIAALELLADNREKAVFAFDILTAGLLDNKPTYLSDVVMDPAQNHVFWETLHTLQALDPAQGLRFTSDYFTRFSSPAEWPQREHWMQHLAANMHAFGVAVPSLLTELLELDRRIVSEYREAVAGRRAENLSAIGNRLANVRGAILITEAGMSASSSLARQIQAFLAETQRMPLFLHDLEFIQYAFGIPLSLAKHLPCPADAADAVRQLIQKIIGDAQQLNALGVGHPANYTDLHTFELKLTEYVERLKGVQFPNKAEMAATLRTSFALPYMSERPPGWGAYQPSYSLRITDVISQWR